MGQDVGFMVLGAHAQGAIEPRKDQQERLEEFTRRVGSGEFHVPTKYTVLCGCIDGRPGCTVKPNSAGGTESLMVADDLASKHFQADDGTTLGAYKNTLSFLKESGYPIGGHDDSHANSEKSGCGANDRLREIYNMISGKSAVIKELAENLGANISEATHHLITTQAKERTSFSRGAELISELSKQTSGGYDHLEGEHNEVMAIINLRGGTTLDRDAIDGEFGSNYQAFNIDLWAFPETAKVIPDTDSNDVQEQKIAALVYYNLATALVLCGPGLRIALLK